MGAQELAWLATLTSLDWTFGAACSLSQRAHYRARLLLSGRYFAQVLEGRAEVTSGKLEIIRSDPRHVSFKLLVERHVDVRTYDRWSMGYLHDLDLEDRLEALLNDESVLADAIVDVMERMQPSNR